MIHIKEDVENYVNLDNFSAFPFESRLSHIRNILRGGNRPLQQVAKRLTELLQVDLAEVKKPNAQIPILKKKIINYNNTNNTVFSEIHFKDMFKYLKKK